MKGFEMIEMILSIIACGLAWKMQSRETRVVAQKLKAKFVKVLLLK